MGSNNWMWAEVKGTFITSDTPCPLASPTLTWWACKCPMQQWLQRALQREPWPWAQVSTGRREASRGVFLEVKSPLPPGCDVALPAPGVHWALPSSSCLPVAVAGSAATAPGSLDQIGHIRGSFINILDQWLTPLRRIILYKAVFKLYF